MNLKSIRTKTGLTQTKFGAELCMGLRQYQRCELANYLSPQAEKILLLMIELKRIHGFVNKNIDCLEIKTVIKTELLSEELESIESALGLFAGGAEDEQ